MMDNAKFISGRIAERLEVSDDLAVFRIEPEAEVTFIPGQFATLGLQGAEGKLVERAYSIASSPFEKQLEFFIELVPEGRFTPSLFQLNTGEHVFIRRKFSGRFVLDERATSHVMAATVTGIAPFVSILRTHTILQRRGDLTAAKSQNRFLVLHGASRSWELSFYSHELQMLSQEFATINYVPTISRFAEDPSWPGEVGRVEDVLRKHADSLPLAASDTAAYLCGHPQMIENARGILGRCRLAPELIHEEKYFSIKPSS